MDYKKMWEELKHNMTEAVREGIAHNLKVNGKSRMDGAFCAYNRVLKEINRLEGKNNESN